MLAAGLLLLGIGAAHAGQSVETRQYRYVMGTSVEVQAFGGDAAARRDAIDEAFAAFADVDHLMSNYRDDSELALLNRSGASEAVAVSVYVILTIPTGLADATANVRAPVVVADDTGRAVQVVLDDESLSMNRPLVS